MAEAKLDAASPAGASSMHQDSRIRVWWHRGERTLAASIRYRHTDPSTGVIVWEAIRYTSMSSLVRIGGTLNSARCEGLIAFSTKSSSWVLWGRKKANSFQPNPEAKREYAN
ncbi:hypothetical protein TNCV_3503291 [Trichonephila clavipes]|uniref:Uncharacterized protein n=1 Tax=Trichonephila clavipes TaxID=2585209 RepID=A0A8X6S8J7_TRICX|nr:hypothetical protein TNCV_3503291 [Trichonephila clavipes]